HPGLFAISCSETLRAPPSFPPRRSSDLGERRDRPRPVFLSGVARQLLARPQRQDQPAHLEEGDAVGEPLVPLQPHRLVEGDGPADRKSTRLNSSHVKISYAVF